MKNSANTFWSHQFRQWHWISSALVLALMLLFGITGFTLNHTAWFETEPVNSVLETELSPGLKSALAKVESETSLSRETAAMLVAEIGVSVPQGAVPLVEFGEMIIDLGGPGVDANLTVDLETGEAFYERIDRGTIAKLNDLHKGRDTGVVWGVMIDITALACVIFCVSGLGLLAINARVRRSTWPLTSLGVVAPVMLYILFVHS
ncbi:MAG: PepSY-associated TM helix domain-containing protein [Pseudomonadota bacterium]